MKRVQMAMCSALLLLFCYAWSHAQQSLPLTRNDDSNADRQPVKNVTGKGTADYIPLWLSGTKIGDSNIFQSSVGVGIGTTAPAATLDVNGAINAATGYNLGGLRFAYGSTTLDNVFLGFAGNSTTTGTSNTASGVLALRNNSTGSFNTATGEGALASNSTGGGNTASGFEALYFNTMGSSNTASGAGALEVNSSGSFNTATGGGALANNTTGGYNAAVGVEALSFNTTGSANTGVGEESLLYNATGSNNAALGFLAGPDSKSPNLSYATAIGAGAIVSQSNALVLGGPLGSAAQVRVGIGTATPANVFTIAQGAGQAIADGWATYSSRRWKTNIETLHGALEKVEQLRGVSYELKANGKHEVGVIAEEVGEVVPEVVSYEENGKDARGVDYSRLTALLIEAAKEQQREFRQQQAELAKALSRIKEQQSLLCEQNLAMRNLEAEVRETHESLRKVKAQVAGPRFAVVAAK